MYLVDTSVWINHFRKSDPALVAALEGEAVFTHLFIVGELALGSIKDRAEIIEMLCNLPSAPRADDDEVLTMIETRKLFERGIGYIDAHLLASTLIDGAAKLWTADKRLASIAVELGVAADL